MSDTTTSTTTAPPDAGQATRLQRPDDYRAERPHLYPSADSFRWFVRQNRAALVEARALVCPTGRWLIQPEAFDRVVMDVGARRAGRSA